MALGIAFLLLTLIAQLGMAAVARNAAETAAAAAARRAARPGTDLAAERAQLAAVLDATVPGAQGTITSQVHRNNTNGWATAKFRWNPPGPRWMTLTIRVLAEAPLMVPP